MTLARFCLLLRNYVSKNTRNYHAEARIYGIISHRKKKYRASRGEMTVDNTSLLVALKQKPHPLDAGSELVSAKDVTIRRPERIQFKETKESAT